MTPRPAITPLAAMARALHPPHRMHRALLLLIACTPRLPPRDPPVIQVRFELPAAHAGSSAVSRDQPPHVTLRLGHFASTSRGIGVVIDRTGGRPGRLPPAKLRFDGTTEVVVLAPTPGAFRRIDYLDRQQRVVLQVDEDHRHALWFYGPDGLADGPIELARDRDADPLP